MLRRTQDMIGTAKLPSAHDQTTDQAGSNQAITRGTCKIPINPIKA